MTSSASAKVLPSLLKTEVRTASKVDLAACKSICTAACAAESSFILSSSEMFFERSSTESFADPA